MSAFYIIPQTASRLCFHLIHAFTERLLSNCCLPSVTRFWRYRRYKTQYLHSKELFLLKERRQEADICCTPGAAFGCYRHFPSSCSASEVQGGREQARWERELGARSAGPSGAHVPASLPGHHPFPAAPRPTYRSPCRILIGLNSGILGAGSWHSCNRP